MAGLKEMLTCDDNILKTLRVLAGNCRQVAAPQKGVTPEKSPIVGTNQLFELIEAQRINNLARLTILSAAVARSLAGNAPV